MLMLPKLALFAVVLANLQLACSGGVATNFGDGGTGGPAAPGVAGNPALCASLESEIEARCGAPADPQATQKGVESCKVAAADGKCGQLFTAVLQCAAAEINRRQLCPGTKEKVDACQAEASAYTKCKTPSGTVVASDASTPPGSNCSSDSTCINGACTCSSGPHKDEPCCDPSDRTCGGKPSCDLLCRYCQ